MLRQDKAWYTKRGVFRIGDGGDMRKRRAAAALALAAALVVPIGGAAEARHTCGLDDPVLNALCESHIENSKLFQKIVCLLLSRC